jgi:hypothetical protein
MSAKSVQHVYGQQEILEGTNDTSLSHSLS